MPWIAGSSRAGYDWPGSKWDRTIVTTVDSPGLIQTHESSTPLEVPFVPCLTHREGFVNVEVTTHG